MQFVWDSNRTPNILLIFPLWANNNNPKKLVLKTNPVIWGFWTSFRKKYFEVYMKFIYVFSLYLPCLGLEKG